MKNTKLEKLGYIYQDLIKQLGLSLEERPNPVTAENDIAVLKDGKVIYKFWYNRLMRYELLELEDFALTDKANNTSFYIVATYGEVLQRNMDFNTAWATLLNELENDKENKRGWRIANRDDVKAIMEKNF